MYRIQSDGHNGERGLLERIGSALLLAHTGRRVIVDHKTERQMLTSPRNSQSIDVVSRLILGKRERERLTGTQFHQTSKIIDFRPRS